MIAIIDYDAGNLKSVEKALLFLGQECVVTRDPETILGADKVILPGVGAFGDAMEKLHRFGLVDVIRQVTAAGTPFWEFVWDCSFCSVAVMSLREWRDLVFWTERLFLFLRRRVIRFHIWDGIL